MYIKGLSQKRDSPLKRLLQTTKRNGQDRSLGWHIARRIKFYFCVGSIRLIRIGFLAVQAKSIVDFVPRLFPSQKQMT